MKSKLPKKIKKRMPKSPSVEMLIKPSEAKKPTTKHMVHEALLTLHTRKGVSLYAIKKYIVEKFNIDAEKSNYLIKRTIKSETEKGLIIQTKGIGAAGSFKLAPKKIEKKIKKIKPQKKTQSPEKVAKKESEKTKKEEKRITKKKDEKKISKKPKKITIKDKEMKGDAKKTKMAPQKTKLGKEKSTPAKKKTIIKRKSIGTIIKPPKMKPKAR
jgi:histone H1/5